MKKIIKTISLLFTLAIVFTSCKEETDPVELNPPIAEFSLSDMAPTQWDVSTITSTATGADQTVYTVTGGEYEMPDETTILFFEAVSYTVTQTVTNDDGTDETSLTVNVTAPDNKYVLDGTDTAITSNAFWYDATGMGGTIYVRISIDITGQDNPNLIKLYPVAGPNPLQATYTYSASGDIGTYDAGMTKNYAGMSYDWTTNGDGGDDFVITLIYQDLDNSDNNIYEFSLPSYTLNYGNWDFASGTFVSLGTKSFSISYRGKIDPI